MERFLSIDWNPSLDDIVDNIFIEEERLEKESTMYKVLVGDFTDPFNNMEKDYKQVNIDFIKAMPSKRQCAKLKAAANDSLEKDSNVTKEVSKEPSEIVEEEKSKEASESVMDAMVIENMFDKLQEDNIQKNKEALSNQKHRSYVPGLVKGSTIIKSPRMSNLSKNEQAICLRVLLKIYGSPLKKPDLSQIDKDDLRTYMNLKDIVNEEQNEYLEFVKTKWNEVPLKLCCEDYINLKWKYKMQKMSKLPRYYIEKTNVPFIGSKDIVIKFLSTCLELGHVPYVKLPTFIKPYMLRANSKELQEWFPIPNEESNESIPHFKLPVSQDSQSESLAQATHADLVISSSGLNCLVQNIGPHYMNTWILPVVIKIHNGKNVIYVDKPMPPSSSTIPEKNAWVYKYILKHFLVRSKRTFQKRAKHEQRMYEDIENTLFGNIYSDEHLKLEERYEMGENIKQDNVNFSLTHADAPLKSSSISSIIDELEIQSTQHSELEKKSNAEEYGEYNVSYKLFSIGSGSETQNQLAKDIINEYRILVRTKVDGVEKLEDGTHQPILLAPKLEHQIQFGAEAVTLEEASKQWISLLFRPEALLVRARISAQSTEILRMEKHSVISINNEIKRLYNVKVEESLTVLHNVIHILSTLTPGRYILRHTVKNGAFATVYKETDNPEKNVIDLQSICSLKEFLLIPKAPWPMLDKLVTLPVHKCFERMPLMFFPPKVSKRIDKNKRKYQERVRKSTRKKSAKKKQT